MARIKMNMDAGKLKAKIEKIYDLAAANKNARLSESQSDTVEEVVGWVGRGHLRAAQPSDQGWQVNEWIKKAILLFFRTCEPKVMDSGDLNFVDKIPVKKWRGDEGVRVVPPAIVRFGAFVSKGCVLMPSLVNIGAYVGEGTMVDTWATVGSCAQIGANVHLSGGVGIGGVLEPLQAKPVIVEDDCFIGSRAIIVEGVHIEKGAVIGAGVVLTASTKIVDVTGAQPVTHRGVVPWNSVVIPGMAGKNFPAGQFGVPCALVIGKRSESTDRKTSLNQALREFNVPV